MINMLFYETKMSMSPKVKQMRYDAAFKLKVVKCTTVSNNSNAATVHGINEKQMRESWKQETTLKIIPKPTKIIKPTCWSGHQN